MLNSAPSHVNNIHCIELACDLAAKNGYTPEQTVTIARQFISMISSIPEVFPPAPDIYTSDEPKVIGEILVADVQIAEPCISKPVPKAKAVIQAGDGKLTPKETAVLEAINAFVTHGVDPRMPDLIDALTDKVPETSLPYMLGRLEDKGYIRRVKTGVRNVVIRQLKNADGSDFISPAQPGMPSVTKCPTRYAEGYGINNKMEIGGRVV